MKFFTKELVRRYAFQNPKSPEAAALDKQWEKASAEYAKQLNFILPSLPLPVQWLARMTFHDAKITATAIEDQTVTFTLDGHNAVGGPQGYYQLTFSRVDEFVIEGQDAFTHPDLLRQLRATWAYEEVGRSEYGGLEYRVLLHGGCFVEMTIVASCVELKELDALPEELRYCEHDEE
ncbi:MAG: DUF4085 family protein [Armatimonadota bacterium]